MKTFIVLLFIQFYAIEIYAQNKNDISVIAYIVNKPSIIDSIEIQKLTHIIYSFSYLKGNKMHLNSLQDTLTIQKLVLLKKKYPKLKVLISLGGWGGCETCSEVFSDKKNLISYAQSTKELIEYFNLDGIDLDWEYPAVPNFPNHAYKPSDKENFTILVQELRNHLGQHKEVSFAIGAFKSTIDLSFEWEKIIPLVDRVHVMSYDLYSTTKTNHHTALYSNAQQIESSADFIVNYLEQKGIPLNKLVIGAAFYTRAWENVPNINNGLYQSGKPTNGVNYRDFDNLLSPKNGFIEYWDDTAKAPYIYNSKLQKFYSFDNIKSVQEKTKYAIRKKLHGIMYWEQSLDKFRNGLLDAMYKIKKDHK